MAYPPRPFRLTSYRQAENAGLDISTSNLDGEFNELVEIVDQIVTRLQAISTAAGLLQQSAAVNTLGLAGQERFVATPAQTTFISTIVFELGTVAIVTATGVVLDPNLVVISNNAGFVQVVIPAQTAGTVVVLDAFQPGAGIVTRLADTASPSNGASMIGINDALALYAATTVEGALAEVRTALNALATSLGVVANLWTRAGTGVGGGAATAPFQLGGFRITGLGDGTAGTDAVTLNQLNAALSSLGFLATLFIRADGTVPFTGDQPMGGHKITGLGAPTGANDATTKTYVDTQEALDLRLDGTRAMTAALNMGTHLINNVVDPVSAQDADTKAARDAAIAAAVSTANLPANWRYFTKGASQSFTVPAGVTTLYIVAIGGGGGGGGSGRQGTGSTGGRGGDGGRRFAAVAVAPAQVVTFDVGLGGQPGTQIYDGGGGNDGGGGGGGGGSGTRVITIAGAAPVPAIVAGGGGGGAGGTDSSGRTGGAGGAATANGVDGFDSANSKGLGAAGTAINAGIGGVTGAADAPAGDGGPGFPPEPADIGYNTITPLNGARGPDMTGIPIWLDVYRNFGRGGRGGAKLGTPGGEGGDYGDHGAMIFFW